MDSHYLISICKTELHSLFWNKGGIKIMCYWIKVTFVHQLNRLESPKIEECKHREAIFKSDAKAFQLRKDR